MNLNTGNDLAEKREAAVLVAQEGTNAPVGREKTNEAHQVNGKTISVSKDVSKRPNVLMDRTNKSSLSEARHVRFSTVESRSSESRQHTGKLRGGEKRGVSKGVGNITSQVATPGATSSPVQSEYVQKVAEVFKQQFANVKSHPPGAKRDGKNPQVLGGQSEELGLDGQLQHRLVSQ